MTDSVEKGNEALLQEYSNFTFQCAACTTEQKFNFNDVHALAKGLRVNCASCDLQLKADACTQGSMNLHIDNHSTFSKGILVFCFVWFSASILVLIFYGSMASGLMTLAGLLISVAIKADINETFETIVLELAHDD